MGISIRALLPVAAIAVFSGACGTSSSTSVNPNAPSASRCSVSATAQPASVGAPGGSGAIVVSTNRECAWEAASENDWLSLGSTRSGQGDGSVTFAAAANPIVNERRGAIVVNGTRVEIGQAAAACAFGIDRPSRSVDAAGGSHAVVVTAQAGCAWSARSDVPWIAVTSGANGSGTGTVTLLVTANTALQPRSGTVTIAGLSYTVDQAAATPGGGGPDPTPPTDPSCAFTVTPLSGSFGADGGAVEVTVAASAQTCGWTAVSAAPWISLEGGVSETGNGRRRFIVAPNGTADPRAGTVIVAGAVITITQSAGSAPPVPCTFTITPTNASYPAEGGTAEVAVAASASTCVWTSQPAVPWITIQGSAGGTGSGRVRYNVAPNPDTTARTGTLTVAGTVVTITQAAAVTPPEPCTFTAAPTTASLPAAGGTGQVTVTASASTCTWSASSNDGWITLQGGSGTGNGTVGYTVAAQTATTPRTGTLIVAGTTVTITQAAAAPACSYSITPNPVTVGFAGDADIDLHVVTTSGCAWTAVSQVTWITIRSGASGTGDGHVHITVEGTLSVSGRVGTVLIGGQTVTVNQGGILNQDVTISGTISNVAGACPNRTFTMQGLTVVTTQATDYEKDRSCSDLADGRTARVRGRGQADGSILATRIDRLDVTPLRNDE
jgi:hypothetical protein